MTISIGIDASNLRQGGGRTHLIELLAHSAGNLGPIERIVVWGARDTLELLGTWPHVELSHQPMLDRPLPFRLAWQRAWLPRLARDVDLVFAPGGLAVPSPRPTVVMARNMLPFERDVRRRYRGALRLKLELLRLGQSRSFTEADAVIFLTDYARRTVCSTLSRPPKRVATIPHGVSARFSPGPSTQRDLVRLLYVSTISLYKHQLELVEAVAELRKTTPVELTLVGPEDGTGTAARLRARIAHHDPDGSYLHYHGDVAFDEIDRRYRDCDVFVFASVCENMPNALLEAMASGLAIACSNSGPMPEVLGEAGLYLDPARPATTVAALRQLAGDPALRARLGSEARARSSRYSWDRCARETFAFLAETAAHA